MKIDIEDTEDKLRRNLIVVSGTVLIATWLRVPLPSVVAALSAPTVVDPDFVPRVWVAAFAIVLYLLGRYHFSTDRQQSWKSFRDDHETRYVYMMGVYVRRARVRAQNDRQREREQDARKTAKKDGQPPPIFRRFETKDIRLINSSRFGRRTLYGREVWSNEDDHDFDMNYPVEADGERSIDRWEIGRLEAAKAFMKTWTQSVSWAKGTFDLLVPYSLGFLALAASYWNGIFRLLPFSLD